MRDSGPCFCDKICVNHSNSFIYVDQLEVSWPPTGLLLTSWQRGGEQGTYFGSCSRLPTGLHQAFNWPWISPLMSPYLTCFWSMQEDFFLSVISGTFINRIFWIHGFDCKYLGDNRKNIVSRKSTFYMLPKSQVKKKTGQLICRNNSNFHNKSVTGTQNIKQNALFLLLVDIIIILNHLTMEYWKNNCCNIPF